MISNGEGWHYIALKRYLIHGDSYFLYCLHSFAVKKKFESRIKVCQNM